MAFRTLCYEGTVELPCLRLCRTGSGSASGLASTIRRHGLSYLPYPYILLFCTYSAFCHPSIWFLVRSAMLQTILDMSGQVALLSLGLSDS